MDPLGATESGSTNDVRDKKPKPSLKRLRLRGDWSDTGPHARPQRDPTGSGGESIHSVTLPPSLSVAMNMCFEEIAQARPTLHQSLMERMTFVLAQMLNENSSAGEGAVEGDENSNSSDDSVQSDPIPGSHSGSGAAEASNQGFDRVSGIEDDIANLRSSFVNRYHGRAHYIL